MGDDDQKAADVMGCIARGASDAELYAAFGAYMEAAMKRDGYRLDAERGMFVHIETGVLYGEDPKPTGKASAT